jgi:hypothetical protein
LLTVLFPITNSQGLRLFLARTQSPHNPDSRDQKRHQNCVNKAEDVKLPQYEQETENDARDCRKRHEIAPSQQRIVQIADYQVNLMNDGNVGTQKWSV